MAPNKKSLLSFPLGLPSLTTTTTVTLALVLFLTLTMSPVSGVSGVRRRAKPPLIEDLPRKRPQRPSHCQFGNQSLEIEERWRPNLGPPFGVLVCVRCECVTVQRKNRLVARVRCKNIKNDCPKLSCESPVLLPEHCCKSCPGEDFSAVEDDLTAVRKFEPEIEEDGKEFSVLMTGRGLVPPVTTDFTARGYFSFAKRNLQYFINYSGTEQPSFIRFTDDDRNILEENELIASESAENATRTVCGIWKKVPRVYRGLLRKGRLHVVVTSARKPEGLVGGKLMKNDLLHTEVFSALLGAPGKKQPGGTSAPSSSGSSSSSSAPGGGGGSGLSFSSFASSCSLRSKSDENANQGGSSSSSRNGGVGGGGNYVDDEAAEGNDIPVSGSSHKCYYEGEIFEDGSQWRSLHSECQMCSCQKGRIKCDQMMCITPECAEPVTVPGECCPTCDVAAASSLLRAAQLNGSESTAEAMSRRCYFEGDKKYHLAGTKWHPYLPPFGFDRCSLCTCLADTLSIECQRNVACPPLACPEREAFRENPMDCCKRCPVVVPVKALSTDQLGDQRSSAPQSKSPNELLGGGGCRFKGRVLANGYEWHPTVQPFGEVKCVNCHCKDGNAKCKRTKCPKLTCSVKLTKDDECCPRCADQSSSFD